MEYKYNDIDIVTGNFRIVTDTYEMEYKKRKHGNDLFETNNAVYYQKYFSCKKNSSSKICQSINKRNTVLKIESDKNIWFA